MRCEACQSRFEQLVKGSKQQTDIDVLVVAGQAMLMVVRSG